MSLKWVLNREGKRRSAWCVRVTVCTVGVVSKGIGSIGSMGDPVASGSDGPEEAEFHLAEAGIKGFCGCN